MVIKESERHFTTREAVDFLNETFHLGITEDTIHTATSKKKIPSYKLFRRLVFKESDLLTFVKSNYREAKK